MRPKKLFIKTFLGFTNLILILGIGIFLPAWSLNYWQGWIYLANFFICTLLITIYFLIKDPNLIEHRLYAGPIAEKEKSQKIIQGLSSIFFIGIFIISGFDYRLHWSSTTTLFIIIANIFVMFGFLIVFFVFKENTYTSGIIEIKDEQKAISTGPYRFIRHPMYSGAFIMLIFSPIALGSFWGLLPVIGLIVSIIFRLLDEEKFLLKNLLGYKEYFEKVKYRLIPGVW